jgi:hypothetical protein
LIEERTQSIQPPVTKGHQTTDYGPENWEALPIGTVNVDAEGMVTFANPAAKRMLGSFLDHFGKFTGTRSWKVIQHNGLDFEPESHPAVRAFQSGKEIRNVVMGILDQEKEFCNWLRVDAIPQFRGKKIKPFRVSMFLTDISESKMANDLINLHLQLGLSLSSTHGLAKSLDLILQHACSIEGFDCGGVYILDQITGALDLMAHRGLPDAFSE